MRADADIGKVRAGIREWKKWKKGRGMIAGNGRVGYNKGNN